MVNNNQDPGSHLLSMARVIAKRGSCEAMEENLPSELNTVNSSGGFMVVSPDKMSVKYTCVNLHSHDVGVVQANHPAPTMLLVYYFEMKVVNGGDKGQVSIGFTTDTFKMRRQPGWEPNSYGYHGDNGKIYRGQGKGEDFGPTYTTGEIVGAGVNYSSGELFFTLNGLLQGSIKADMVGPIYPTVAVHSLNEEVSVNFGKQPFSFNLKAYEEEERMKQQMIVENIPLPPNVSYGIVRSYLLHYGYESTFRSLEVAGENSVPPIILVQENGFHEQDLEYALSRRNKIRQLIQSGGIDLALNQLREWYPQILQDNRSISFLLHCQKFIEFVRVGNLEMAVTYGRDELASFFGIGLFDDLVKECVSLLAYKQPHNSSVNYLLEDSRREFVADAVNIMILLTNPNLKDQQGCLCSYLERILKQLTACSSEKRFLSGNQGEAFDLHRVLNIDRKS